MQNNKIFTWKNVLSTTILFTLIYFVVFARLGSFAFRPWDEAMFAVNAYEMSENGNMMVPTFDHEVDLRNTKPLLVTWVQVACIKIFGFSEWSIRFPSACAVFFSILVLFSFLKKYKDELFAWTAVLILMTSSGYLTYHTGRTGDADALLSFFLLAMVLNVLKFFMELKNKYVLFAGVFFSLAIMTKSFAAMLFILPLVAAIILYRKQFLIAIKTWHLYVGIVLVTGSLLVVFIIREHFQPGFLNLTFQHDAGRLIEMKNIGKEGWRFFLEHIFYTRFSYWSVFFFIGLILMFKLGDDIERKIFYVTALFCGFYILQISISSTKMIWYDMPVYPFLACIAAIPIYQLIHLFQLYKLPLVAVTLFFIFLIPYHQQFYNAQSNKLSSGDRMEEAASIFLYEKSKRREYENITIFHHGFQGSLLCYKYKFSEHGAIVRITKTADFEPQEKVFVHQEEYLSILHQSFHYDTLEQLNGGIYVQIK
ncbi:MAG: glycosyltransferase family 39 protein [Crocinitomicaceae bacterium]|nr:glycosyltransferase family 39 protein [Crocinitomicaceae bacterium]MBK8927036.1 glycosyltransferase family 39 protein [Crocinitomicaceae bacterium]